MDPFPSFPVLAAIGKPGVGGTGVKSGRVGGRGFTSMVRSCQFFRCGAMHPEPQGHPVRFCSHTGMGSLPILAASLDTCPCLQRHPVSSPGQECWFGVSSASTGESGAVRAKLKVTQAEVCGSPMCPPVPGPAWLPWSCGRKDSTA
ncbi:unnamed protein product [Rangifer tarandus platyrhynchus]|uniref:Uncharacterized protein n=1 Tax=Rangifer tarandus platyrhynchus TaxID=3082113 RepID=A0AC60A8J1_RANTA